MYHPKATLCSLLLALSSQAMAQNAIVIHYNDGKEATIPMSDIDCITFSEIQEPEPEPEPEPEFPVPDGSKNLYQTDKAYNLMLLMQKTDSQRAMSRSMFPELTDDQFATIKKKADEICQYCKTDDERIATLNKWVRSNMSYEQAPTEPWTVFQNLKGVCQAYSNLLKVMLLTQDIPCVGINGWYSYNGAHAWVYGYDKDGKQWYVCDPTNASAVNKMTDYKSYSHLRADFTDIELFEDEEFAYNLYNGYFNVCRVKKAGTNLVIPYSKEGYVLSSFNPNSAIPSSVRSIYLGSNIQTIGSQETRIGLKSFPAQDERCYVDENNKELGSYEGVVYTRNYAGELNTICYIPVRMTTLKLMPMEKVEKNTVYGLEGVEVIEFPLGTKSLEAFAIENCPSLKTVRIPKGCQMDANAIYRCGSGVQVEEY